MKEHPAWLLFILPKLFPLPTLYLHPLLFTLPTSIDFKSCSSNFSNATQMCHYWSLYWCRWLSRFWPLSPLNPCAGIGIHLQQLSTPIQVFSLHHPHVWHLLSMTISQYFLPSMSTKLQSFQLASKNLILRTMFSTAACITSTIFSFIYRWQRLLLVCLHQHWIST